MLAFLEEGRGLLRTLVTDLGQLVEKVAERLDEGAGVEIMNTISRLQVVGLKQDGEGGHELVVRRAHGELWGPDRDRMEQAIEVASRDLAEAVQVVEVQPTVPSFEMLIGAQSHVKSVRDLLG